MTDKKDNQVHQLAPFRSLKLYLDNMLGNEWVLAYKDKENGGYVYVPNENLSPTDQVFMGELIKQVIFNSVMFEESDD